MNDATGTAEGPRRGRKILLGLFALALLAAFVWLALDMSSQSGLAHYEQEWEAKGEHFALADFVPKPVPDAENFALTPIVASCSEYILDRQGHKLTPPRTNVVNRLAMPVYGDKALLAYPTNAGNWAKGVKTDLRALQLYYRALAAKTNEFPVPPQPGAPAADVLLALSRYSPAIEELRRAATLPDSRFPLNYDSQPPAEILLPHLASLKGCALVLQLRAVAELQNGQSEKALADVKLMLRLADAIRNEPFLISHLVRIAMVNLTLQPVWEGTQEHAWSDAQLAELDRELAKLNFLADYEFTMRGERALAMANIEYIRRTRNLDLYGGDQSDDSSADGRLALRLIPKSVFYQNELLLARVMQQAILPVVNVERHRVSTAAWREAETNIDQVMLHFSLNTILARMFIPGWSGSCLKFAYMQSAVDQSRVACALERFRLAEGGYPQTLDAVAPRFLAALPPDVIGGEPLKYRRTGDGRFALYSVGWNGVDNGGQVVLRDYPKTDPQINYEQGDWVWAGQIIGPH